MRVIPTFLRTFIAFTMLAAIASAVAAMVAKGRMTSRGTATDDEVDVVAIYEATTFASTAPALRRASVTTWYGGGTVDLRGATLDPAGARLTVRAVFGGLRLVVPETWRVELKSMGVFGGIGDSRSHDLVDANGPLLTIDGIAIFGGVGIVATAPDLDTAATASPADIPMSAAAPA